MPFKERDFYKLVNNDGTDFYSGKFDYVDAIGYTAYVESDEDRPERPRICTSDVIHASARLTDAMKYLPRRGHATNPMNYRILVVHGTPVCNDGTMRSKHGFFEFEVVREITELAEVAQILFKENQKRKVPTDFNRWVTKPMSRAEALATVAINFASIAERGFKYETAS